jgi:hypothetical protein
MSVEAFKNYLSTTPMTFSYKAVTVLALLNVVDHQGKAGHSVLVANFHAFYLDRRQRNLIPEKMRERNPSPLFKPDEVSDAQIWQILTRYPLELMSEFIDVDDNYVRIKPSLWRQMGAGDLVELKEIARQRIANYYEESE